MPDDQPLNIAVWGIGRHALRTVLPAIHASSHVRLAGVVSRNETLAEAKATEYGCRYWRQSDEMLASAEVDLVYVASPVAPHYAQTAACLDAGKHVVCEKSLTASAASSADLVRRAQAADRLLLEAFMYLYNPRTRALTQMVARGELGALRHVACHFTLPPLEQPGYRFSAEQGGGALLDVACYGVSLALALDSGMPDLRYAHLDYREGVEVDMAGTAMFRLSGGGHLVSAWGYGSAYRNEVTLIGEKRSVDADFIFSKGGPQSAKLAVRDGFGRSELIDYGDVSNFAEMFAYVNRAARDPEARRASWRQTGRQAELMGALSKWVSAGLTVE